MRNMIAVDPGDVYVGVAFFEEDPEAKHGWTCTDAVEMEPDEFADSLAETIIAGELDVLVYERFRLYADKAVLQTGSEFETSQLIGVIKWLVRVHNKHVEAHATVEAKGGLLSCEQPGGVCNDARKTPVPVALVAQMADIKKPTRGILNKKKIKSIARPISKAEYGGRDHVVDAELHGWKWILDPKS